MLIHKYPVILLAGPTASGKSMLAIKLATHFKGIIINADSMQIYSDIPIITASPSKEDKALVSHHLYNEHSIFESMSVAIWRRLVVNKINQSIAAGNLPIIVGGTGLYFKALEFNLSAIPDIPQALVGQLSWQAKTDGIESLYAQLCEVDPHCAVRIKSTDTQRTVRALSVYLHTKKTLTEWQQEKIDNTDINRLNFIKIYLNIDKDILSLNAQKRFTTMLDQGAVDEVRTVYEIYDSKILENIKAVGLREIGHFLQGNYSWDVMVERTLISTRQYIKRQRTWFRHQFQADYLIEDVKNNYFKLCQFIQSQLNNKKG